MVSNSVLTVIRAGFEIACTKHSFGLGEKSLKLLVEISNNHNFRKQLQGSDSPSANIISSEVTISIRRTRKCLLQLSFIP